MHKIAIIDDVFSEANALANLIDDRYYMLNPVVTVVYKAKDIENFNPDGYGLLIIDQNLFNGFNLGEEIDGFTGGETLARKFVENGYNGKIILYTGDSEFVEKRNHPSFFEKLFGDKPIEGAWYIDKGSGEGQKQIMQIVEDYLNGR